MKKLYVWNYADNGMVIVAIAESIEEARKQVIEESIKNQNLAKEANENFHIASEIIKGTDHEYQYDHPLRRTAYTKYYEHLAKETAYFDDTYDCKDKEAFLTTDKPFVFDLNSPMAYILSNNNE
jgi:hypothetical protein